jgi:hypothetical protein
VKTTALLSPYGNWALIGKYNSKKALLTLKGSNGSLSLSEKDIKPIVTLLGMIETYMKGKA